jgi:protein-S-isoprenylcysteine O-methyltransferase Ste14
VAIDKNEFQSFLKGLKQLLGMGIYLLLVGILIEIMTMVVNKYVAIPISIPVRWQILLTSICVILCISGLIWFNKTLNLAEIYLKGGENKLITKGPFNYVRHPLYTTLMMTLPPLFIIWFEDIFFMVSWILIYLMVSRVVKIEEQGLVKIFGEEYERYKEFVPGLIPYKRSGGEKFRQYYENKINEDDR